MSVGLFGLLVFSPSASSATSGSSSSANTGSSGSGLQNSSGFPQTPGASSSPNQSPSGNGIYNISLPKSFIAPGEALFAANCASCHGSDASGTDRAPNLQSLGAGTVDFWVSTGRMPLADSSIQATRKPPRFNNLQSLEISAYVQSLAPGGVKVPTVNLSNANVGNGSRLFTLNCAACHTITGAGDALADGAYAPSLHYATTRQIVEAVRSGPGNMPHFGPGNISNAEVRDITAYVHSYIQHPVNRGGFGLGGIGPVGEGFVGLLIGVGALLLVCFWIGDRT
ncbi:MAG TPA: c-type cytochrome [Acidimicrobiales bacterium]|nr:c-type cytochrome [Acidimicrobiales bacterium]